MTGMNGYTLQILHVWFKNIISIYWATRSPVSRCQCEGDPTDKNENIGKYEPCSDRKIDEHRGENDNNSVADRIVRHIGSGAGLQYVVQWPDTVRQTISLQHCTTSLNTLSMRTGDDSTSEKNDPTANCLSRRQSSG